MTGSAENVDQLFQELDAIVADLIDQFASQGQGTAAVIETLKRVLERRMDAQECDPDPAEDDTHEAANDWPGAEDPCGSPKE